MKEFNEISAIITLIGSIGQSNINRKRILYNFFDGYHNVILLARTANYSTRTYSERVWTTFLQVIYTRAYPC